MVNLTLYYAPHIYSSIFIGAAPLSSINYAAISDTSKQIGMPGVTVAATDRGENLNATYQCHRRNYQSGGLSEVQLRIQFVDPLNISIGWDVRNERGYGKACKDVMHEDAVTLGTASKAPDYAFRVGGVCKFSLKTKPLSIVVTCDAVPAYQLREHSWSANLLLSVLTKFERFAVYDTRIEANQYDSASTERVMLIHHSEYLNRWNRIAGIYHLESIRMGSINEYTESTRSKRGADEVGGVFLADLESPSGPDTTSNSKWKMERDEPVWV